MNNAHLVSSLPDKSKRYSSSSNVMRELLSHGMQSHEQHDFQLKLWDGVMEAISISKQLSFLYVCSYNNQQSDSDELFRAFDKSKKKVHLFLEKFLNSFISNEYDDDQNKSSNIETHDQTQVSQEKIAHYEWNSRSSDRPLTAESKKCVPKKPRSPSRSRSREFMEPSENKLRPNTRIRYPLETEFRSKSRKFIRSPSNSRITTKSRNVNWPSPNSLIPIQCEVRNRSRSKSQDRHELDTKSMHTPVKKYRSLSGHLNRSPSNDRIQIQQGRRNRSRSRSYNGQQFDSKSTKSTKKRQPRIRERFQYRSSDQRKHATKNQSLSKSKQYSSSSSSKKIERPQNKSQGSLQKSKKSKSSPLTEFASSSGTSQLNEEPPTQDIDSNAMMIPPQNAYPVPRPFYQNPHNAPAMFYPSQPCVPRLMAPPYYMPSRPRLAYPSTYPRVFYRPHWQPETQNVDTQ
ncbi:uncharacterized protein LOC111033764 isoform X2 [Myzus persicae]|uniref:uncharacterized protein LOC111033764 isoform X2 n=1 Tax=Myzus persicae TaxID=13164 RepID=UPI000B92FB4A|nr:uncharacterized protein LOC111033764 isoform X2 [Myzus persicae]